MSGGNIILKILIIPIHNTKIVIYLIQCICEAIFMNVPFNYSNSFLQISPSPTSSPRRSNHFNVTTTNASYTYSNRHHQIINKSVDYSRPVVTAISESV
jgi:hypothetical protein